MALVVPITSALSPLPYAVERYLNDNHPRTSKTYRAKARDLELFVGFCVRDFGVQNVTDLTRAMIEQFVNWRAQQADGPATIKRRLATIKHFCREVERGHIPTIRAPHFLDPTRGVRPPSIQLPQPHWLNAMDVARLCEQEVGNDDFKRLRNRFALYLLFYCGLRSEEARTIRGSNLSDDGRWLVHVHRKGNRWQNIPVPERVVPTLSAYSYARYLFLRPRIPDWDDPTTEWNNFPLLISPCRGRWKDPDSWRLSAKSLWNIVDEAAHKAGLSHVHPHMLRHTYCHELATRGVEPRIIQQLAGHADINMTMRYCTPSEQEKEDAVNKL